MAYLSKTQVKETREALKVAFPDFKFWYAGPLVGVAV